MINLLNTLMPWRKLCLICSMAPIITVIGLFFVPETPQWFLSRNRHAEAEKSLRWVRGWASREAVAQEFNEMKQHSDRSKFCKTCLKQNLICKHPLPSLSEKFAEFKRKRTIKPLFIVVSMFIMVSTASLTSFRHVLIQIFKAYDIPIPTDEAMTILSIFEFVGYVTPILLIRFFGKRRLYLTSLSMIVACIAIITWFGFSYLPLGYNSYDRVNGEFHLENKTLGYIPMIVSDLTYFEIGINFILYIHVIL